MRLRQPRKGSKPKGNYRGRRNVVSTAKWCGVRPLCPSAGRSEKFEVRLKNGEGVYLDTLEEVPELMSRRGKSEINSKIPTCPGVYWSVKLSRWLMVGHDEKFEVAIMAEGDLEDVLGLFESTLP